MMLKHQQLFKYEREELQIMAQKHPLEFAKTEMGRVVAKAMRRACPVPGDTWDKFMTVLLEPGESVAPHKHTRHAILWYPDDCESIVVNGEIVPIKANQVIHMEPGVEHSVPCVAYRRLSVAMLVSE